MAKAFKGWPNQCKAAVALTYDDALGQHVDEVAPALEAAGLRGTFYIPVGQGAFIPRVDDWRTVAKRGHELGNHSLFHPCRRRNPGDHQWLDDAYDLVSYSERRWQDEMRVASFALELVDGKTHRTFGNTCCDEWIGPHDQMVSIHASVRELFPAARGPYVSELVDPQNPTFEGLGHFGADDKDFDRDLLPICEQAKAEGKLAIFMIHGVGDAQHRLHIKKDQHARLLEYLGEQMTSHEIWTAPLVEIVGYLKG